MRDRGGGPRDRALAGDDQPGAPGARQRCTLGGRSGAPARGGTQAGDDASPDVAGGPGGVGRTDGARRSGLAAPVDLPEHAHAWRSPSRPSGTPSATRWSPSCCTASATACRATSRRGKAGNIPTGTRSFATSRGRWRAAQRRGQPTISVDTKKKELVGPFKNGGRAWRPAKTPQRVRVHDFVIPGATGRQGHSLRRLRSASE